MCGENAINVLYWKLQKIITSECLLLFFFFSIALLQTTGNSCHCMKYIVPNAVITTVCFLQCPTLVDQ